MRVRGLCLTITLTMAHLFPASSAVSQAVSRPHDLSRQLLSGRDAAAAGMILVAVFMSDEGLRAQAQAYRGEETNSIAQVGNAFGDPRFVLPALSATYLAGQLTGNRDIRRVALRAAGAAIVASGVTTALKYTIGRSRPAQSDDSDLFRPFSGRNGFPSGHTTLAFAVATAIADETQDRWSDVALYGAATWTAFARVSDDRHWTSDVLVGALIGHLSARWLSRRQRWLTVRAGGVAASFEF